MPIRVPGVRHEVRSEVGASHQSSSLRGLAINRGVRGYRHHDNAPRGPRLLVVT